MKTLKKSHARDLAKDYGQLIKKELNYEFSDINYLLVSMIHSSIRNECKNIFDKDNEKLEFIGDSVLDLIVSNFLYFLPKYGEDEGSLTVNRSKLVNKKSLAKFAKMIDLEKYLITSKSGKKEKISANDSVLADSFEALIGAMFLDGGYDKAEKSILYRYKKEFLKILQAENENYKSLLSEYLDKNCLGKAQYILDGSKGPDHNKIFKSTVLIENIKYGTGLGKTKKESESKAAKKALEKIESKK